MIGATGAIGQALVPSLVKEYGLKNVLIPLHRSSLPDELMKMVTVEYGFDIRDEESIRRVFQIHSGCIDSVWNLAAPLSVDTAKGMLVICRVGWAFVIHHSLFVVTV